ncbi:GNAT family N-acetyltransferase [Shewanella subflava]|nr:GNAT family N-acetyltransferase [Shewanella subflava]
MLKWTDGEMPMPFADKLVIDGYVLEVDVHFNGKTQLEIIATGMIDLDSGFIDAIFVDPQYMGLGAGKEMLAYLERLAVEAGLSLLKLESTLNAAAFYRKCGFEGDEVSVYQSPRGFNLNCIVMCKKLT